MSVVYVTIWKTWKKHIFFLNCKIQKRIIIYEFILRLYFLGRGGEGVIIWIAVLDMFWASIWNFHYLYFFPIILVIGCYTRKSPVRFTRTMKVDLWHMFNLQGNESFTWQLYNSRQWNNLKNEGPKQEGLSRPYEHTRAGEYNSQALRMFLKLSMLKGKVQTYIC